MLLQAPSAPARALDGPRLALRGRRDGRPADPLARLTSAPVLLAGLVAVTLLAAGPLQGVDEAAHGHWAQRLTPGLQPFIQHVLDPIAGQAVCLPVLLAVAGTLSWRHRTWRPLWCAAMAELAFYGGVGLLKVVLARPAPTTDDADLFGGGLRELGWSGISFPSGHAAEAVLIYGTAVYLVGRWTNASARTMSSLRLVVGAVALNAVAVSYYLGWHWISDLVGGLLVGGLLLRLLVEADRRRWRLRPRRGLARPWTGWEGRRDETASTGAPVP
ncbi:phosphatase PAP2 family protein [Isoptericola sp. 4D.3]|jgi:membrane-associated phospholipid phosphatase|uniref:Phosphatase PAP2 family protein n=1 Tax=Isoptericola peretonis TaxID=2918523 RepID=A0ABT0IYE5_9MICO|nr:phosphatase PAP2 family protein [Isoptericola sp. 4D.3]